MVEVDSVEHIGEFAQEYQQGLAKCEHCGRKVEFAANQFSKLCPSCGNYIKLKPMQVKKGSTKPKAPECFVCMDRGFLILNMQNGGYVYEAIARCYCSIGQNRPEKGWPLVTKLQNIPDLRFIADRNRREWQKRHPEGA